MFISLLLCSVIEALETVCVPHSQGESPVPGSGKSGPSPCLAWPGPCHTSRDGLKKVVDTSVDPARAFDAGNMVSTQEAGPRPAVRVECHSG